MRNKIVVASVFAVLTAAVSLAQSTPLMYADVPFEFTAGKGTLPAGKYVVYPQLTSFGGQAAVRSEDRTAQVIVMTVPKQAARIPEEGKLIFNRYGEKYFLSELWLPGREVGQTLPKSRTEREIAKGGAPVQVAVLFTPAAR